MQTELVTDSPKPKAKPKNGVKKPRAKKPKARSIGDVIFELQAFSAVLVPDQEVKYNGVTKYWHLSLPKLMQTLVIPAKRAVGCSITFDYQDGEFRLWLRADGLKESPCALPWLPVSNAQDVGGQITYFKRYLLGMLFNIATVKDDDAARVTEIQRKEDVDEPFLAGWTRWVRTAGKDRAREVLATPKYKAHPEYQKLVEAVESLWSFNPDLIIELLQAGRPLPEAWRDYLDRKWAEDGWFEDPLNEIPF